jgi:hypothetical protein
MRAARSKQRLDPGEVIQDHRSFHWCLPVVVRRSACDPVKDHVGRGAEQDDRVETVVELRLVPHAPLNEERATIIQVQQSGDPSLDPEPLPAVQFVGGLDKRAILAPARIIGVYDAIAASAEFGERRRLARSRYAGARIRDVGTTLPTATQGRVRVGGVRDGEASLRRWN